MEAPRPSARRRPVTLDEIAAASGVSRPTASVILNGAKSGTRISPATSRRVLDVAKARGYRPNPIAQHLATGKANRIGFYSGRSKLDCRNAFFAEILGGVFEGAAEFGFDTLMHTSSVSELQIIDLVRAHSVDGLIVYATIGDPILPLLGDLHVPAVSVADEIAGIPSVLVDDQQGGALLAAHLLSLGHRHALVKQSPLPPPSAVARVRSFTETFEQASAQVTQGLESWDGPSLSDKDRRLLSGPNRATAVMAWSDAVAETIVLHLLDLGFSVPGDVSVVGFDGFDLAKLPRRRLTTIRAPWADSGREAVHMLHSQLVGEEVPDVKVLPVTLCEGDTTGVRSVSLGANALHPI
jgi:LacI family transcriptional regulator